MGMYRWLCRILVVVSCVFSFSLDANAGSISVASVSEGSLETTATTTYTFTFTPATSINSTNWSDGVYFTFDLDDDFTVSGATLGSISPATGMNINYKNDPSGTIRMYGNGAIVGGTEYTVVLNNIQNPTAVQTPDAHQIKTGDGASIIDTGSIAAKAIVPAASNPPIVQTQIPDKSNLEESEGVIQYVADLNNNFFDSDGDTMTFSASSSDSSIVAVSLSGTNNRTLSIQALKYGSANITVTATTSDGSVDDVFGVTTIGALPISSVTEGSLLTTTSTSYTFVLTPETTINSSNWSDGAYFVFDLDDDYTVSGATLGSISPPITGMAINNKNDTTGTIQLHTNTGAITGGQQYTIVLNSVQNPAVAQTPDAHRITTSNGAGTIDTGTIAAKAITAAATNPPVVQLQIADKAGLEEASGVVQHVSDLNNNFFDSDGDTMTFSAVSSDSSIVAVSLSGTDNRTLSLLAKKYGSASITVTATSVDGSAVDTFNVSTIGALSIASVSEGNLDTSATTSYTFVFTPKTTVNNLNWSDGAYFVFDLDDDFTVNGSTLGSITPPITGMAINNRNDATGTIQMHTNTGAITGGQQYTVVLNGVQNPSVPQTPVNHQISTSGGGGTFDKGSIAASALVAPSVDLQVTKAESVDPVVAGSGAGNLTHTVTVTNAGPSNATGVTLSEALTLPTGVSIVSITPSAGTYLPANNPNGTWTVGNLGNGASATLTVIMTVGSATAHGATISDTATVTAVNEMETNATNDSATETTTVQRQVDIQVSKADTPDPVTAGSGIGNLTHTVTVTNAGPSDASGVALSETISLPAGVSIVSITPSGTTSYAPANTSPGTWTVGTLASGASETLTVVLTVGASTTDGATVSNTAAVTAVNETDTNATNDSATENTTVQRQVDLQVSKTDTPDPVTAGSGSGNLTYVVTVTNAGPSDSSGVALSEVISLPTGASIISITPSGTTSYAPANTSPGTWTVGTLASGASESLTVVLTVGASTADGAIVSNTAAVTAVNETLINVGDDTATENTTVQRRVDLQVSKTDTPDPVTAGSGSGNLTYVVTVANAGPSDSSGVALSEVISLPSGVSIDSITPSGTTSYAPANTSPGTWTVGTLASGASETLTVVMTVGVGAAHGAIVSNTAAVTAFNETLINTGDDTATENTTVETNLDFGDAPDPLVATAGEYPTLLANDGARHVLGSGIFLGSGVDKELDGQPDATATGDDLADTDDEDGVSFTSTIVLNYQAYLDVVASSACNLSAWIDFNRNGSWADAGEQVFADQVLAAGVNNLSFAVPGTATTGTSFMRFRCTSDSGVSFDGVASDGEVEDYQIFIALEKLANLSVSKTDGVTTAVPGQSVTYSIVAANAGPDPAAGVSLVDSFPAGLTCSYTSIAAGGASGNSAAGSGNLAETLSMPVGSSVTYTATCNIASGATGTLSNTASVSSSVTDPTPANNSATDADTVLAPQADLSVTKSDGVTMAVPGQGLTYTIVAANAGPSVEPAATLTDSFPAGLTCSYTSVAAGGATGNTAAGSGDIAETLSLPVGSSVTYTAACNIASGATGTLSNTATLVASVTDPVTGNNIATDADTLLIPEVDLSITKDNGVDSIKRGEQVIYTIVVDNAGPSDATGVTVSDSFARSLVSCSWTSTAAGGASGNTASGSGTIAETVNIPAAASITYTATCTIASNATVSVTNTAVTSSAVTDLDSANNSASDIDSITYEYDYGDAPVPFPTLLADNGASHILGSDVYLGSAVDAETDGQPAASADGDDADGGDDEDGVIFGSAIVQGEVADIDVTANAACLLSTWVDYNGNGSWADVGEQVFSALPLTAGVNSLSFIVPLSAVEETVFARFRCTTDANISFTGLATDGEVEDYPVIIEASAYRLNISLSGTGTGTVTADSGAIDCGENCIENYAHSAIVALSAAPDAGSEFVGWSGDCSGTEACQVQILSAQNVIATFDFIDSDNDGLPDLWEEENGLDPTVDNSETDSDGDGVSDVDEFNNGTNPTSNDSDNDGLLDGVEESLGTDPLKLDTDGDGLADLVETRNGIDPLVDNHTMADSDGDCLPDSYEESVGLDPNVPNGPDSDSDGDGFSDGHEYMLGLDPLVDNSDDPDSDGDGILDTIEDALGMDRNDVLDADLDQDGDGMITRHEIAAGTLPTVHNSEFPDSDGDGIPDSSECFYGLDVDGMNTGLDSDDDGIDDVNEYRTGSHPLVPDPRAPVLQVETRGVNLTLDWQRVPQATGYRLYYAPYPFAGPETVGSVDLGDIHQVTAPLWPGAAYYLVMQAYNDTRDSGYSDVREVFMAPPPYAPQLSVLVAGAEVTLSWSGVFGAEGYILNYDDQPFVPGEASDSVDVGDATELSFTLPPGAIFYVSVQARNDFGLGPGSDVESVSAESTP